MVVERRQGCGCVDKSKEEEKDGCECMDKSKEE
jgi:hypothetical protein